jgi:hypothetical protein
MDTEEGWTTQVQIVHKIDDKLLWDDVFFVVFIFYPFSLLPLSLCPNQKNELYIVHNYNFY